MPEVRSKVGQQPLEIRAAAIPLDHPVHSGGVPKVVYPRLTAGAAVPSHTCHFAQTPKGKSER